MPRELNVVRPYVSCHIKGVCATEAAEAMNGVAIYGFEHEYLCWKCLCITNYHADASEWKLHCVKVNYTAHHIPYIAIQDLPTPTSRYKTCCKFYLKDFTPDDTSLYNNVEEYFTEYVLT